VKIVDVETDEVVGTFNAPGNRINWFAWSGDGEHLATSHSSDEGGIVTVVDRSGLVQATIERPGVFIPSMAFDATGTRLAIAVNGRSRFDPELDKLQIWDWGGGNVVDVLDVVAVKVLSSPTTNTWVTTTFNGSNIDVWDATTGDHLQELSGHTGIVRDIVANANGTRIATASDDGTARIWNPATGVQVQVLTSQQDLTGVAIDMTGSRLATMDSDGIVRVWALDRDELTVIAKTRVTRQLDDLECRQYLHVDRCDQA